jgi:alpha-L-fucosidase
MMNRRNFTNSILVSAALRSMPRLLAQPAPQSQKIEPTWESIRRHQVPEWYEGAKLGIFIHWGLYSVPAWAPTTGELGSVDWSKWFRQNPYAEWYLNTLRIKDSPTYQHHVATYGKDFDYYQFAPMFNEQTVKWDPESWASVFKKTGARYAVLTTKHHDGFRLWPSKIPNPRRSGRELSATRDLVGDLTAAVRAAGMKMGLYYSGGLDWTFTEKPIQSPADLQAMVPQEEDYARYADAHWTELTDRYQPAVMWNDINYPKAGKLPEIFAHYYNTVKDGVINNRFGVEFSDFTTPEYAKYDKITEKKWESCRGLGFSFGYNQAEGPQQVIASEKLIWLLIDIVSKNGNLLLNIGPRPDGSISDIQLDRLNKLGEWLAVNGEGIFDSRPWVRAAASEANAPQTRFTRKNNSVYAYLESAPSGALTIPGVIAAEGSKVRVLGADADSEWTQQGRDLKITARGPARGTAAVGVRITPEPWQVVKG